MHVVIKVYAAFSFGKSVKVTLSWGATKENLKLQRKQTRKPQNDMDLFIFWNSFVGFCSHAKKGFSILLFIIFKKKEKKVFFLKYLHY